jgi:hypothetical protein
LRHFSRFKEHAITRDEVDEARRLLDRIDLIRDPCDLDLLLFFARHRRILLASEQLAILLGYEFTQVAASLDLLQRAGLVTLSENATYTARMYIFAADDQDPGWLPDLLQLASTREGRLSLVGALSRRSAGDGRPVSRVERAPTAEPGARPDPGPAKRTQPHDQRPTRGRKGKVR